MTFGERLRHLRALAGMTQAQLAAAAKVHITQIRDAESGLREPRLTTARKLARALRDDGEELIGELRQSSPDVPDWFLALPRRERQRIIQERLDCLVAEGVIVMRLDESGTARYWLREYAPPAE
jgi:transcriptional regulator with XRE-family HTH domain